MNRAKRTDLITIVVLCVTVLAILLSAMLGSETQEQSEDALPAKEVTYEDYNGKKIGIATGTNLEAESFKYFPDSEYLYFDGYSGLTTALALDPTMIAEVLTVIRELAREGMTMIIVTHEMRFARTVSNRVFYMDEGGIYEQGSPEQIFEHPTREKTRRFIKRLKKLQFSINASSYDYLGTINQLEHFGSDAALSPQDLRNVTLAIEELVFQCIVPAARKQDVNPIIDVLIEHSESDDTLTMQVNWGGEPYNPLEQGDELALSIVDSVVKHASYSYKAANEVICTL